MYSLYPFLKFLGAKLPVHLLCTVINTTPDDVILPKNWHIGEINPFSQTNSIHPINEVTHSINPDTISTSWTQQNNYPHTTHKTCNNPQAPIKTSFLMPSDIQVPRQVPLHYANILEEMEIALHKLLKNLTPISPKAIKT